MPTRTSAGRDFQDNILSRLMERRRVTTLYLCNRMTLRGRVLQFDPYVVLLEPLDGGPPQMVYKSAVVSVSGPQQMGNRRGPQSDDPRDPREARPDRPHFSPSGDGTEE